jgi:transcription termination factor NusB
MIVLKNLKRNNMKQTAVEFLYEILHKQNYIYEDMSEYLKQAKEMEKEQMRDASCPFIGGWEDDEFEYWYNETYKK